MIHSEYHHNTLEEKLTNIDKLYNKLDALEHFFKSDKDEQIFCDIDNKIDELKDKLEEALNIYVNYINN